MVMRGTIEQCLAASYDWQSPWLHVPMIPIIAKCSAIAFDGLQ